MSEMEKTKKPYIGLEEQETHISYMRNDGYAEIFTSDSTQMTRLDRLCKTNPDMYSMIREEGWGKTYRCNDKSLISLRSKKRTVTDEQRQAASERMKKYQTTKQSNLDSVSEF